MLVLVNFPNKLADCVLDAEVLFDLFGRRVGILNCGSVLVVGRWGAIGSRSGFVGWVDINELGLDFLH
jgi:hypothetical protein